MWSHQGGLLPVWFHQCGLLSVWFINVVSHLGGLLPLIPKRSHQSSLSGWSFISMLSLIKVIPYLGFQWVETNTAGL